MGSLYRSKHEMVFVYRVGDAPHANMVELGRTAAIARTSGTIRRSTRWREAGARTWRCTRRSNPSRWSPTRYQDVTKRGDLVFDMFLGSGTSLIAAERIGRRFRGCDIDPAYVDVAVERWVQMTGGTPNPGARMNGRFQKGQSGNPAGRPEEASAARVGVRHHLRQDAHGHSERRRARADC